MQSSLKVLTCFGLILTAASPLSAQKGGHRSSGGASHARSSSPRISAPRASSSRVSAPHAKSPNANGGSAVRRPETAVHSYTKKNGTHVDAHNRTLLNGTRRDNYSTKGNVNPHTGKAGTKPPVKP